jgi:hypothetical protein
LLIELHAQILTPLRQRMPTAMLTQHQTRLWNPHRRGLHNLVRGALLQAMQRVAHTPCSTL